ncbi:MAG: DUF4124 domain-containing protein, partial [Steroidobacteraceae bacterium]
MTPASSRFRPASAASATLAALLLGTCSVASASSAVYKWVDATGITHLSSTRPPAGVAYERVTLATSLKSPNSRAGSGSGATRVATTASPEQSARRDEMVTSLRTRECVVALEAIDRMGKGGEAVDPAEFRRLQQTADRNCSKDSVTRGQQEEMAARLRVAKGDVCIDARNKLADMLEPGRRPTREQLKGQQEFIESHCTAPVRGATRCATQPTPRLPPSVPLRST